jgi:hypothetical protein
MSNRSWFYAAEGQQRGPCSEAELRQLIGNGAVGFETLVWTAGMAGWQKAGEVPGLMAGDGAPPAVPRHGGGPLSIDFGILDFTGRSLLLLLSLIVIIPAPWAIVMYCRWIVSCVHVPGRANLGFTGRAVDLMWFYGAVILFIAATWSQSPILGFAVDVAQLGVYWMLLKWFLANLNSDGQPLGLRFSGSVWGFIGWSILAGFAFLTIIGWAWVYVAQIRWICRHIEGTQREVVFSGTGLEFLWRSIVSVLLCIFIIPIPWMYRWMTRWLVSQTALVERTANAA